jgi:predicted peptidase
MSDNEYIDIPFDFKNRKENIDSNRIYLTGLSMGLGRLELGFCIQETFAALVPVAGFVDRVPMIEDCKTLLFQLGFFHGLLDDVVNVDYSIAIYKKLKACNADVN